MLTRKDVIEEGDWVIAYESYGNVRSIQVKRGESISNQFGAYKHADMIGKKYGSKLASSGKVAAAPLTLLHPTPQLWTDVLSHRTQILFQLDISLVLYHLHIRPGSVVLEAGTGSASLSHGFARAVAPHGHLHTFEFNADRVAKAQQDLDRNGMSSVVTVRHRDVCGQGFPFFSEGVDAVFLDLPTPWLAVDDAHRSLRPQGRLCSFSPCIEQVQRTCVRLAELDYEDIITIEVLQKTLEVHKNPLRPIDYSASRAAAVAAANKRAGKGARPEDATAEPAAKAAKTTDTAADADTEVQLAAPSSAAAVAAPVSANEDAVAGWSPLDPVPSQLISAPQPFIVTKPAAIMRGHTGYLTFARKACSRPAPKAETAAPAAAAADEKAASDA